MQVQSSVARYFLAHCCAIFLCSLGRDDHHRNPNTNDRDHLVGQLTSIDCANDCRDDGDNDDEDGGNL